MKRTHLKRGQGGGLALKEKYGDSYFKLLGAKGGRPKWEPPAPEPETKLKKNASIREMKNEWLKSN